MPAHASPVSEFKVGVNVTYVANEYQVGVGATEVAEFEADLLLTLFLASKGIFPLNISLFCDRVRVDC